MGCSCTGAEYACIRAYVNPCDEGIPLGLTAGTDGDYTVLLTSGNSTKRFVLSMAANAELVLPNEINNSYSYEMQILDPDGELLNDTCYTLTTELTLGSQNSIQPSPQPGANKIIVVDEDGDSFTNSFFATHTIIEIVTNNQAYIRNVDFTQSGSTITWINGNKFFDGQTILAQA